MICFSAVARGSESDPTWSLLVTTTESPDALGESVTICPRRDATRSVAVTECLRAAQAVSGVVFIQSITDADRVEASIKGLKLLEAMPAGAETFLKLAGRGSN